MFLLLSYVRVKMKTLIVYKLSMFSDMFGQILQMILYFFFWTNIYHVSSGTLQYVMWSRVIYGFIAGNSVWGLCEEFKSGNISVKLSKPIGYFEHTYVSYIAEQVTKIIYLCIPLSCTALIICPTKIKLYQIIICTISVILSVTICFCFDYIISLFSFCSQNTWGISAFRDGIVQVLSGAIIPIALMPESIQEIVYFLPFAYMVDIPANILLSKEGYLYLYPQSICCFLMIIIALVFEKVLIHKLQIQGG